MGDSFIKYNITPQEIALYRELQGSQNHAESEFLGHNSLSPAVFIKVY
jgi:hypothetical protein